MKRLICSRCDDNIKEMTDISLPLIKDYANKCNADFMVFDHISDCNDSYGKWHYRIMKMGKMLQEYDRVLHLDSDIIINKNCPDIFEHVPKDKIASVFEDKGTRTLDRRKRMEKIQKRYGSVQWHNGYINTGVFLVSKRHSIIFDTIQGDYWTDFGYDDVHLGYNIHRTTEKVFELDYKFNHMSMFSEPWNQSANRFDSYIIHYAGKGIFNPKFKNRIEQMKHDKEKIYG